MIITPADCLIRLADNQYPVTIAQMRQENPQCLFGESIEEEDALTLGYAVVHQVARPMADVVTELAPQEQDGRWQQVWLGRSFTDKEVADRVMDQKVLFITDLEARRDAELAVGFPYTHQGQEVHIQLRLVDRVNLIALKGEADYYVQQGMADQPMEFRPFENVSLRMTATEMVAMANAALSSMKGLYAKVWGLKDQVTEATTPADFPEIPDSFFS
jgi:hypothetical protein